MPEDRDEPEWIEKAVDWYALPSSERVPSTAKEFYESIGVPESTFFRRTSTPEFDAKVIQKALSGAKKYTSNVLEALRVKAVQQGNVLAQISFLKLVVQLAERFSHEEKKTVEFKTIYEFVEKTSKELEELGVDVNSIPINTNGISVKDFQDNKAAEGGNAGDAPTQS